MVRQRLKGWDRFRRVQDAMRSRRFPIDLYGLRAGAIACVIQGLLTDYPGGSIIVVPTEEEAQRLRDDLAYYGLEGAAIDWWDVAPYRPLAGNAPIFGERAQALATLAKASRPVAVVSLRTLLAPVPPPEYLRSLSILLREGEPIEPTPLATLLERYGYLQVHRVSIHGEFALRGEVLDLFLPAAESAVRIVFEYDCIEQIKRFDPITQASLGRLDWIDIPPLREVIWDDERLATLSASLERQGVDEAGRAKVCDAIRLDPLHGDAHLWYRAAFERPYRLLDWFGAAVVPFWVDWERLQATDEAIRAETERLYDGASGGRVLPPPHQLFDRLESVAGRHGSMVRIHSLSSEAPTEPPGVTLQSQAPQSYFGNIDYLKGEIRRLREDGFELFVAAGSQTQAARLSQLLSDMELTLLPTNPSTGFVLPDLRLALIHEAEIFSRRRKAPQAIHHARSQRIDTFVELNPDDYVVHLHWGIGRYEGIERLHAGGRERDWIRLRYANEDFIYLPIEQINLIQRYIGAGEATPKLDSIGGRGWQRRKARVRQHIEELAGYLTNLYARRSRARGFAFPPNTEWQTAFEASFPYEETPDQLKCIREVMEDMERQTPMDRLICGDVGYGKTEVAIRASFKALMAGKQAAFLAPTTILAEQHYNTLVERFRDYPMETAMLSRFVPRREQQRVLEGLHEGRIDIVVGTHRLLQRDVRFRDLGLIIVDEEQRFGVKDKERLKQLKLTVDCLTLTATPIPRTLHMSLLKLRDMSLLNTPPRNRHPIETVVEQFSAERVRDAIREELQRGGQVYYLHNRINTLQQTRHFLEELLPDALISCAHGQMHSDDLEEIMRRFVGGAIQVLVSTTIIENGIDIPNVNTIIIDRADIYGISQLYQLRGRVGRSDRVAYAWLLYPERNLLSEMAMKRLQIVSDFSELGDGFKIALKDLEVRGAGNLLGREQSGDIGAVGFDLYLQLLDEALRERHDAEKTSEGESEDEPMEVLDVHLELEYSGFIPDDYIADGAAKMEIYKRIASVWDDKQLASLRSEIEDRFGPPPEAMDQLLALAEIRLLCREARIGALKERRGVMEARFAPASAPDTERLLRMVQSGIARVRPDRPDVLLLDIKAASLREKATALRERLIWD